MILNGLSAFFILNFIILIISYIYYYIFHKILKSNNKKQYLNRLYILKRKVKKNNKIDFIYMFYSTIFPFLVLGLLIFNIIFMFLFLRSINISSKFILLFLFMDLSFLIYYLSTVLIVNKPISELKLSYNINFYEVLIILFKIDYEELSIYIDEKNLQKFNIYKYLIFYSIYNLIGGIFLWIYLK